jgi:hypothetical protein
LKRRELDFEKEARAIILNGTKNTAGFLVPIDLDKLIENVVVSPLAEEWFVEIVKNLVLRYQYQWPVEKSKIMTLSKHYQD